MQWNIQYKNAAALAAVHHGHSLFWWIADAIVNAGVDLASLQELSFPDRDAVTDGMLRELNLLRETSHAGTGAATRFAAVLGNLPVLGGSVAIATLNTATHVATLVANDDGVGHLAQVGGSGVTGAIDYATGAYQVDFPLAVPIGTNVVIRHRSNLWGAALNTESVDTGGGGRDLCLVLFRRAAVVITGVDKDGDACRAFQSGYGAWDAGEQARGEIFLDVSSELFHQINGVREDLRHYSDAVDGEQYREAIHAKRPMDNALTMNFNERWPCVFNGERRAALGFTIVGLGTTATFARALVRRVAANSVIVRGVDRATTVATQIAHDDGAGTLVADAGSGVVGTIDYATGALVVTLTANLPATHDLAVAYGTTGEFRLISLHFSAPGLRGSYKAYTKRAYGPVRVGRGAAPGPYARPGGRAARNTLGNELVLANADMNYARRDVYELAKVELVLRRTDARPCIIAGDTNLDIRNGGHAATAFAPLVDGALMGNIAVGGAMVSNRFTVLLINALSSTNAEGADASAYDNILISGALAGAHPAAINVMTRFNALGVNDGNDRVDLMRTISDHKPVVATITFG